MSRTFKTLCYLSTAFLIVYGACYFYIDLPVTLYAHSHLQNGLIFALSQAIAIPSLFFFAIGIFLFCSCFAWRFLSKQSNSKLLNLEFTGASLVLTSFTMLALKHILGRYRPPMLFSQHLYGFNGPTNAYMQYSSPSGHSGMMFALMISLCFVIKNTLLRTLFILIAIGFALARVVVLKHYLGDVIFGAYLAFSICFLLKNTYYKQLFHQEANKS